MRNDFQWIETTLWKSSKHHELKILIFYFYRVVASRLGISDEQKVYITVTNSKI